ncbi:hypothetical protein M513_04405, partial [Trichuris suis]
MSSVTMLIILLNDFSLRGVGSRITKEQKVMEAVIDMLKTHIITASKECSKENNEDEASAHHANVSGFSTMQHRRKAYPTAQSSPVVRRLRALRSSRASPR